MDLSKVQKITIPASDWDWIGGEHSGYDPEETPETALGLTTIEINGVLFHLEAIEVEVDKAGMQEAKYEELWGRFNDWYMASGSDGHVETVEIDGRTYALFASPFC